MILKNIGKQKLGSKRWAFVFQYFIDNDFYIIQFYINRYLAAKQNVEVS